MDPLHDNFTDAEELTDRELVYPNWHAATKWMDNFGGLGTNPYQSKNLLLLVRC